MVKLSDIQSSITRDNFSSEVILGDGEFSLCDPRSGPPFRIRRASEEEVEEEERTLRVYDGSLDPDTNYSGFVEVQVWGPDGQVRLRFHVYSGTNDQLYY
ncbi:hypothetical protein AVEN_251150-1 [Araneus ventricosus]|uniref:Uncharacterized protein n=1 Tax=Araneus ventricosus TaxID=182803 RepID=A0A4Y2QL41_ARAVE|nr:hypothetical protein AVEN_251150-1 [Araneus ventricosus]